MKDDIAQINPVVTFKLPKPINAKANKKYVFILNTKKMSFRIEGYYWFMFKNWFKRLFSRRR